MGSADQLMRLARRLNGCPSLPPLLCLTDPVRTPDVLALAVRLPPGAGLIYRHFGVADRLEVAAGLARLCRTGGVALLIAADPALAATVGADGVHWPERLLHRARETPAGMIATGAAHSAAALRRAAALGLDAALLSVVFASASASAGRPLGPLRAGRMAQRAGLPVYALGGVNGANAARLRGLGFAGFAGVGAF